MTPLVVPTYRLSPNLVPSFRHLGLLVRFLSWGEDTLGVEQLPVGFIRCVEWC